MSDGQVNLVLGPETHNGVDKKIGDAGDDKNKQRDRTLRFYAQSNPASIVIGTIDDNMSDVGAAQIVAIFGTLHAGWLSAPASRALEIIPAPGP